MKILYAHFVGLKGIYNKSQKTEIEIDFTRCKHNMVIIVGKNGSGKSTLMDALQPMPDNPLMYLDNMEGLKEITYFDNGDIYKVVIKYPVNVNGQRTQTKAFLQEIQPDGTVIELNSNGNIGSYKETLYARFNLDPNFVSLSQLSIEDRGIVDKKPSERKKYVTSLLEATEVYNDIYKALVKRSGVFNSIVNSISAKIDSIGDEEKLKLEMESLLSRLNFLNKQKEIYSSKFSKAQATVELLDPNGAIQVLYTDLIEKYNDLSNHVQQLTKILDTIDIKSEKEALDKYKEVEEFRASLLANIQLNESKLRDILVRKEDELQAIQLKQQRISALSIDVSIDSLKRSIAETRKNIFEYETAFKKIGLHNFEISKEEYVSGLNTLNDLRNMVLTMKSYASMENINKAVDMVRNNISPDISELEKLKSKLEAELAEAREKVQYYTGLLSKLAILDNRPDECNINHCVFIKDALEAQSQQPKKALEVLDGVISDITNELINVNDRYDNAIEINRIIHDIDIISRTIRNNSTLLNRLPNGSIFSNHDEFLSRISNGDNFNDIRDLYGYISYGNMLELYKSECKTLSDLESTYNLHKEKVEMVKSLSAELTDMVNKLNGIESTIESINSENLSLQKQLSDCEDKKHTYDIIIDRFKQLATAKSDLAEVSSKLSTVESNVAKISQATQEMNNIAGQLANITSEIGPKQDQLDNIKFSLAKLLEYREELEEYTSKVALVEAIKKYSSPTKGGIQMLFMKLYMDKTLSMSNQLLSLLFDGQLELLPYEINENEFKIPCRNTITSVVNDDISSCSTAERSMISMIISFALLHQSSTKYNILKMDEADATLDQENRSSFPTVISNVQRIMGVEMCLMVSHSSEIDMSDVDIINLSPVVKEKLAGNVIFSLY